MKRIWLSLLLAVGLASAQTAFSTHGQLKISGKNLQDQNSSNYQLRGMSLFWGNYFQEGRKYWNPDVLNWLVRDWKINVIRVPVGVANSTTWANTSLAQTDACKLMIDYANNEGIYVIVDWHTHLNDGTTQSQAKAFFTEISAYVKNKGYKHVLYEIFNEPLSVSMSSIRDYANQVIPLIRANDATGIIIVGTPNWSSEPDQVGYNNRANGTNIAYTLHFYAGEGAHSGYRSKGESAMNSGNAVFVTEWGTSAADGGVNSTYINTGESDTWINWMSTNNVSWANWTISHKNESSSIFKYPSTSTVPAKYYFGGWTSSDLKPTGVYVRKKLRQAAGFNGDTWDTPTSSSSGTVGTSSSSAAIIEELGVSMVHPIPGAIQAENFQINYGTKKQAATSESAIDTALAFIDEGDWTQYNVQTAYTGPYNLSARVALPLTSNGSLIEVVVDGTPVTEIPLASTGSYTKWATVVTPIELVAGTHAMRLNYLMGSSGKAIGFFNLNWLIFEFTGEVGIRSVGPRSTNLGVSMLISGRHITLSAHRSTEDLQVAIYDLQGHLMQQTQIPAGQSTQLQAANWKRGHYIAKILNGKSLSQVLPFQITE